jgi:hypothetical protein
MIRRLIPAEGGCPTVRLTPGLYGRSDAGDPCVTTRWDGRDATGRIVAPGIYVLRLRAGDQVQYQRMLFVGGG